eukprot:scaffold87216_cov20-Tisochrysis_lutea.AAC.1
MNPHALTWGKDHSWTVWVNRVEHSSKEALEREKEVQRGSREPLLLKAPNSLSNPSFKQCPHCGLSFALALP